MDTRSNSVPSTFLTTRLHSEPLRENWDRIFGVTKAKDRILTYLDTLTSLGKTRASVIGLATRRSILFVGEPGTGKSSLAQGAPNEWARVRGQQSLLVTVNTHDLASAERGGSQKNVGKLFASLAEVASTGLPTFVVVDEAETIGTNRANINPSTNPQDSVFSVNAWLQSLDTAVARHANLFFMFTTNFYANLDPALAERMDFTIVLGLPDDNARIDILQDALREISDLTAIPPVPETNDGKKCALPRQWIDLLKCTKQFSARRLRHLVVSGLTFRRGSEPLQLHHLLQAVQDELAQQRFHRKNGGVCLHEFQQ